MYKNTLKIKWFEFGEKIGVSTKNYYMVYLCWMLKYWMLLMFSNGLVSQAIRTTVSNTITSSILPNSRNIMTVGNTI